MLKIYAAVVTTLLCVSLGIIALLATGRVGSDHYKFIKLYENGVSLNAVAAAEER